MSRFVDCITAEKRIMGNMTKTVNYLFSHTAVMQFCNNFLFLQTASNFLAIFFGVLSQGHRNVLLLDSFPFPVENFIVRQATN